MIVACVDFTFVLTIFYRLLGTPRPRPRRARAAVPGGAAGPGFAYTMGIKVN
jgi:hypothetical protein